MNKKRLIISAIAIILLAISFVGGSTYAKYRTEYVRTGYFQIARWAMNNDFLANGTSVVIESINLATTYDPKTLVNGKIAPGTSGSFEIKVDATGTEVGVDYKVEICNITGPNNNNLLFSYDGENYFKLSELPKEITGSFDADQTNKLRNITVNWKWPYETLDSNDSIEHGDIVDTINGVTKYGTPSSLDVKITCTQQMPTA